MKFPFSLFGKKPKPEEQIRGVRDQERVPFPVDLAVAQVQESMGVRFGTQTNPQSELLEAAAVLSSFEAVPTGTAPLNSVNSAGGPNGVAQTQAGRVEMPEPQMQPVPTGPAASALASEEGGQASPPISVQMEAAATVPEIAVEPGVGRDEVIAAYRLFLRRDPESDAVIAPRLGMAREKLLGTFMVSPEFLQRAENINLVLEIAKALELRLPAAPTPGVPVMTQTDIEAAKRIFWPSQHDQAIHPQLGETADRTLARLMRSEHFQKNDFNAQLVRALAKQILERLNQK